MALQALALRLRIGSLLRGAVASAELGFNPSAAAAAVPSSEACMRQMATDPASSTAMIPSTSGGSGAWMPWHMRHFSSGGPASVVSLSNLRDNEGATKRRIRVGRGNSGRRGNYCGRGMNGQNSRGRGAHMLYDGGQLGLLKFPIFRQRPPFQVLFTQLGLAKLVEYIQLGLLPRNRVITMKDLQDVGCVGRVKYGVLLYGKASPPFPVHIQVTACDPETKAVVEAAGGSVTRVYYEEEGLKALLHPSLYTRKNLPLPLPAHSWHPRYNGQFDAIGQLPPVTSLAAGEGLKLAQAQS